MKKTLKKLFLILLMFAVVVTLAGCGDKDKEDKDDDDKEETSQTDKNNDDEKNSSQSSSTDDDDENSSQSSSTDDDDNKTSSNKSSNDKVTISKKVDGAETTLEFNYKNDKIDTVKMTIDAGDSDEANEMLELFEGLNDDPEMQEELESQFEEMGIIDFSTSDNKLVIELNSTGLKSMGEDVLGDSSLSDITSLTPDELREYADNEGFIVE